MLATSTGLYVCFQCRQILHRLVADMTQQVVLQHPVSLAIIDF